MRVADAGAVGHGTRRALCWARRRPRIPVRPPAAGGLPTRPPPGPSRPLSAAALTILRRLITGRGHQSTFITLFVKGEDNMRSVRIHSISVIQILFLKMIAIPRIQEMSNCVDVSVFFQEVWHHKSSK